MSGLEFEKNMQQKLDGFNLHPSDAVWTAVEKEIRKDKRRHVFLWWSFLLLSLTAGGYFTWQEFAGKKKDMVKHENRTGTDVATNNSEASKKSSQPNKNALLRPVGVAPADGPVPPAAKENSPNGTTNAAPSNGRAQPGGNGYSFSGNSNAAPLHGRMQSAGAENLPLSTRKNALPYHFSGQTAHSGAGRKKQTEGDNEIAYQSDHATGNQLIKRMGKEAVPQEYTGSGYTKNDNLIEGEKILPSSLISSGGFSWNILTSAMADSLKIPAPHSAALTVVSPSKVPAEGTPSATAAEKKKDSKKLHWQWGAVMFTGGAQTASSNELTLQPSPITDVAGNYYAQATPAAISPGINSRPSKVEAGFSYSAGVFGRLITGRRLAFTAALQYARYNTFIDVGDKGNAALYTAFNTARVNAFYRGRGTDVHRYNNSYHFIELPLALEWQLNRSKRMPLYWSGGPHLSYLFNTNALQYDSRNGVYYTDNSFFNRWQIGVSTGFQVGLLNQSRLPIRVGPWLGYDATMLVHQVQEQHLLYLGIKAQVLLKK